MPAVRPVAHGSRRQVNLDIEQLHTAHPRLRGDLEVRGDALLGPVPLIQCHQPNGRAETGRGKTELQRLRAHLRPGGGGYHKYNEGSESGS
ncbi:MAG: hypothetical protein U1F61_03410 [Opitutaceae bacterium]